MASVLSDNVGQLELTELPLDPDDIVSGSPVTTSVELDVLGSSEIGIWEISTGTVKDIEVDEVFVVLSGRGQLDVDGTTIDLRPGVAVRLDAGDRTVWTIRETLRKLYVS